jgi:23S rRNA pseudouridine955/2504/2580 synthase
LTDVERSQGASHAEIDAELAGQRLDNFLLTRLKGVPRSHVYRLIRSGQVRVNSGRVKPHYRLKQGDSVRVPPVRRRAPRAGPGGEGLAWLAERIIFEDDRLIVVDKPSGLAVHGGSGLAFGLIEGLRSLRPNTKTLELVHRLDRATSGCVMVAKKRSALRRLHALLREGAITKRYLALVKGRWEHGELVVDTPLTVRRDRGAATVFPDADGKASISRFRLIEQFGATASLVEVTIETGRTHQIRVHAAAAGHPIAGDDRYGDTAFNSTCLRYGLKRMFLHAHLIEFVWPDSDDECVISAPLPDDLKSVLESLEREG